MVGVGTDLGRAVGRLHQGLQFVHLMRILPGIAGGNIGLGTRTEKQKHDQTNLTLVLGIIYSMHLTTRNRSRMKRPAWASRLLCWIPTICKTLLVGPGPFQSRRASQTLKYIFRGTYITGIYNTRKLWLDVQHLSYVFACFFLDPLKGQSGSILQK